MQAAATDPATVGRQCVVPPQGSYDCPYAFRPKSRDSREQLASIVNASPGFNVRLSWPPASHSGKGREWNEPHYVSLVLADKAEQVNVLLHRTEKVGRNSVRGEMLQGTGAF